MELDKRLHEHFHPRLLIVSLGGIRPSHLKETFPPSLQKLAKTLTGSD